MDIITIFRDITSVVIVSAPKSIIYYAFMHHCNIIHQCSFINKEQYLQNTTYLFFCFFCDFIKFQLKINEIKIIIVVVIVYSLINKIISPSKITLYFYTLLRNVN